LSFSAFAKSIPHEGSAKQHAVTQIDQIVDNIRKENGYPGVSMVISLRGNIYYDSQHGVINIEKDLAANMNTKFIMYSVTKGLTQILALILSELRVLDLDAPIGTGCVKTQNTTTKLRRVSYPTCQMS
jgi:CubicO group peptidase (beta-lactamase class C family)